jgi:hypothetical protein
VQWLSHGTVLKHTLARRIIDRYATRR